MNIEAAANAQLGNYSESIEQYRKIISLAPDYAEAHYNLGSVFWDMGDRDKSMQSYQYRFMTWFWIIFKPNQNLIS